MKPVLSEKLKSLALALAVAAPMSYVLQISMGIWIPAWYALAFSLVWLVVIELVGWNRVTAISVPAGLLLLGVFLWWSFGKEQRQFFIDYYWWAIGFLYNGGDYPMGNAVTLSAISTLLVSLYCWLFGRKFFFFPAVFALVVGFVLFKWLHGLDIVLLPGMLAVAGLIALWAKSFQRKTARKAGIKRDENGIALAVLPIAAAVVLLSLVSVSVEQAAQWQNRQVYDLFERFNNYIADYTNFNRPRNVFSIARFGFMPMGNRLGGPIELSDAEVLHVTAPHQMLLRGTVYNDYDGKRWADTTGSQAIRLNNTDKTLLDNAFDRERPALTGDMAETFGSYIEPISVHVYPVLNGASTLFVPYRGVTGVTSDKFLAVLPRFNAKGEVFSSSDVHAGYGYTIAANYLNYNYSGFDTLIDDLLALGLKDSDEQAAAVRKNYLALPKGIESSVYEITNLIVAGAEILHTPVVNDDDSSSTLYYATNEQGVNPPQNAYQKALAIKKYLADNCKYTLTPSTPPEFRDFVSHFLLHDTSGYCTYFASSMAIMARIAGIPSRYVEGYAIPAMESGQSEYIVRGENAHAWAELYFEGIGWIPFDATPPADDGEGGTATGVEVEIPLPVPTKPPMNMNDDDIGELPVRNRLSWEVIAANLWLLPAAAATLLLLWAFAMMIRAKVRVALRYVKRKYPDAGRQCAFYYSESLKLLEYYNYPVKTGETPIAYAARIDRWLRLGSGTFGQVANLISRISYSNYGATGDDTQLLSDFRRELAKYTYQTVGPWFYLWRHVLGFKPRSARLRNPR